MKGAYILGLLQFWGVIYGMLYVVTFYKLLFICPELILMDLMG